MQEMNLGHISFVKDILAWTKGVYDALNTQIEDTSKGHGRQSCVGSSSDSSNGGAPLLYTSDNNNSQENDFKYKGDHLAENDLWADGKSRSLSGEVHHPNAFKTMLLHETSKHFSLQNIIRGLQAEICRSTVYVCDATTSTTSLQPTRAEATSWGGAFL